MHPIQKFSWAASGATVIFAALLILLVAVTEPRPQDRHGGVFVVMFAVALLPISAYLFVVGLWFKKAWPGRWWLLALPPIAIAGFVLLCFLGVVPPI